MHLPDPLELLTCTDRWRLGCGPLLYAPPQPRRLDAPGFLDACIWRGQPLEHPLRISFLHESAATADGGSRRQLVELFPYLNYWHWRPDRITARYYLVQREGLGFKQQAGVRVFLNETRRVEPDGSLHCELDFDLLKGHPPALHVLAWSAQPATGATFDGRALSWRQSVPKLRATLSGSRKPTSAQVEPGPLGEVGPSLPATPLWPLRRGRLDGEIEPGRRGRLLYAALHWKALLDEARPWKLDVRLALRETGTARRADINADAALVVSAEHDWRAYFAALPHFQSSDAELTRRYWQARADERLAQLGAQPPGALVGLPAP